jgi:alpha-tubulin suppressor-like RCC1 family protein
MLLLNKENIKAAAIAIFLLVTVPIFSLQLGDGTDKDTYTPIKVMEDVKQVYITDYYNTFIIKNDNSLWATGYNKNDLLGVGIKDDIHTFMKVMDNVKSVSNYTILKTDGTLWAMRMNEGLIDKIDDNVVKVSAGYGIMYIKADNTLWGYGENYKGSFGTGLRGETYPVPKKLRDNVIDVYNESIYSLIITTDNELFISGVHYLPKPYTSPFILS